MLRHADDLGLGGWLPDEIVFSLASRYHRITGNRLSSTTCRLLFGHPQRGSAHDFPSRIDTFVERTKGALGTAAEVIQDHTILPIFQRFITKQRADDAQAALRGDRIGSLKYRLGLLTSRFGANFPLKACIDCMREDLDRFRVAYWHRAHQLPGVWVCQRHNSFLMLSRLKATGIERFSWQLPALDDLHVPWPEGLTPDGLHLRLRLLAQLSRDFCDMLPGWRADAKLIEGRYRTRLVRLGLASPSGRLRLQELSRAYLAFCAPLLVVPEFASLPRTELEAQGQVIRLLYRTSAVSHPLRHLLAIIWLFENCSAFMSAPHESPAPASKKTTPSPAAPDAKRMAALDLVMTGGKSPSAAAKLVGVDPATVMAWLAREGVASRRRPKSLVARLHRRLIQLLRRGASKAEVATQVGVSLSTVTRILRTDVGLHDAWSSAKHRATQERHRRQWSRLVRANSTLSIPLLRNILPNSYAWLYRNDKSWLSTINASRFAFVPSPPRGIDWAARDSALAKQVKLAAIEAIDNRSGARISLARLVAGVPGLKPKLRQLARLPLTARALNALLPSK